MTFRSAILVFLLVGLSAATTKAQVFVGFSGSFEGSAEGEGVGLEIGYRLDSNWTMFAGVGSIFTYYQAPAHSAAPTDVAATATYNSGPEWYGELLPVYHLDELWAIGLVLGGSYQSRVALAEKSTTKALVARTRETHLLYGADLRVALSESLYVFAGFSSRRGKRLGIDFGF